MAEKKIRITAGRVTADAVLNASKTAAAVWDALPLDIPGETWGDEIYFGIPVTAKAEDARESGQRDPAREPGQRLRSHAG